MSGEKIKIAAIVGPTASGKTALGVALARRFDGEVVSVDSRQVYRGLDIGSGKDLAEYAAGGPPVLYHLLDIVSPEEVYDLARFRADARAALLDIASRGRLPIAVGGSALYLDCLFRDYALEGPPPDPALRAEFQGTPPEVLAEALRRSAPGELDAELARTRSAPRLLRALERAARPTPKTALPPLSPEWLVIGVYYPRSEIHRRVEKRLDDRLQNGLIEEVRRLRDENGLSWERLDFFGLEYRYISLYLKGELSLAEARDKLLAKIRRLARSQDIWFRKMEREGLIIHWIPKGDLERAAALIADFRAGHPLPPPEIRLMDIYYGPKSA